ncbi:hypothetical protein HJG60_008860 [Phyllostomus discolor]|uniref:Uncharacterized protein n=1 Tax=Phyllostomus discolor TaxID=89673 RepID=A0A833YWM6_9CHIR|nr:hypothetical protein HJG60_008860 [Phyllostomus discolor]
MWWLPPGSPLSAPWDPPNCFTLGPSLPLLPPSSGITTAPGTTLTPSHEAPTPGCSTSPFSENTLPALILHLLPQYHLRSLPHHHPPFSSGGKDREGGGASKVGDRFRGSLLVPTRDDTRKGMLRPCLLPGPEQFTHLQNRARMGQVWVAFVHSC